MDLNELLEAIDINNYNVDIDDCTSSTYAVECGPRKFEYPVNLLNITDGGLKTW